MPLPSLPTETIENVIDQAMCDTKTLRNLALTCHDLLPRSRYHLFHSICFRNVTQLYSFYDFLDVYPHVASFVISLALSATPGDLQSRWLLQLIPTLLLRKLPSLCVWKITDTIVDVSDFYSRRSISFSSPTLTCLKAHGTAIVELHLDSLSLRNCAHFAEYILAFRGLKVLHCEYVDFKTDLDGTRLYWVMQRLAAQLQLSTLIIGKNVPYIAVAALLQSSPSTLLHLELHVPQSTEIDVPAIVSELHGLRSLELTLYVNSYTPGHWEDEQSALVLRTFHIIKALGLHPESPLQSLTIHFTFLLSLNPLFNLDPVIFLEYCRELEAALLRLPSLRNIQVDYDRGYDISDLTSLLERYLPILAKQRPATFKCLKPGRRQRASYWHEGRVWAVAVSPDSKWIASGSGDLTIILWDIQRQSIIHEWVGNYGWVLSLAFSPDSQRLASAGMDGKVAVWDIGSSKVNRIAILEGDTAWTRTCIRWSPDGTTIVSGSNDNTVRIWDAGTYQQLHLLQDSSAKPVKFVRFSPDGRWIASGGESTSCDVWDAATGDRHIVLRGHSDHLRNAVFDLATGRIATASADSTIRIWDVEMGGEALVVLEGHTRPVRDVAFSLDGRRVVSGSDDATVKVWDHSSGDLLLSLEAHTDDIRVVRFSPDGKYIASASVDTTVRLWRASDGTCIKTFTEHTNKIRCLEYSPDGETLVSGGKDEHVFIRYLRDVISEENPEADGLVI